jgi:signal transduction histidine kinase
MIARCTALLPIFDWPRYLLWYAAFFMLLAASAVNAAPALGTSASDNLALELTQARFSASTDEPAQTVALPDTWAQRGLPNRGAGVYRITFDIPVVPQQVWALRIDRLADQHEIRLNGALVSGRIDPEAGKPPLSRATPTWIPVPPQMLRSGTNELQIAVRYSTRAGLSPVWIGPAGALWDDSVLEQRIEFLLPVMLNCAGSALGLFMLLFWWRRRSEVLVGTFGLLWLLISLRSTAYFTIYSAQQGALFDAFMYISQILSALLLGLASLALADRGRHWWRRLLFGLDIPLVLLGIPAAVLGEVDTLRTFTYPLVLGAVIPPLVMVAISARRLQSRVRLMMLSALLTLVITAAHDYLGWRGELSVMARYWMPLALPLVFSIFAWTLMQHMVQALEQVEQLNADLEGRVTERTHALELANLTKTRFLAAASHDLRQPVVTIGLLIDLLREHIHVPAQRRMIDRVNEAEALLKGLLDLSRLEAGTVQPRFEVIELQALFDAIAAHVSEAARHKGLKLRLRPTPLAVRSDRVLLEQIVRNLISNAVRYTERGGVLVSARRRGHNVVLQVWDTGNGIAADQQERIFEEFVQGSGLIPARPGTAAARSGRRNAEGNVGLGLGLAIVRRAVQLLGHRLNLASQPGRGSCFALSMDAAQAQPSVARVATSAAQPLQNWRVALVDDNDQVRAALAARLAAWGADVESHASLTGFRHRRRLSDHRPAPVGRHRAGGDRSPAQPLRPGAGAGDHRRHRTNRPRPPVPQRSGGAAQAVSG